MIVPTRFRCAGRALRETADAGDASQSRWSCFANDGVKTFVAHYSRPPCVRGNCLMGWPKGHGVPSGRSIVSIEHRSVVGYFSPNGYMHITLTRVFDGRLTLQSRAPLLSICRLRPSGIGGRYVCRFFYVFHSAIARSLARVAFASNRLTSLTAALKLKSSAERESTCNSPCSIANEVSPTDSPSINTAQSL